MPTGTCAILMYMLHSTLHLLGRVAQSILRSKAYLRPWSLAALAVRIASAMASRGICAS